MPAPAPLPGRVLRPMPDDLARLQALLAERAEDPGEQLAHALRTCGGARVSELAAAAGVSPWVMRQRVDALIAAGRAELDGPLVFPAGPVTHQTAAVGRRD
ncbi:hypothetical protein BurJ1DRAFT_2557 [Burkholderiales bacterium JOSHI_001]|nr:hypothetical protein BurJ1DRAFT_2557 [Burkholderiales bacterium JOSHI_001]